MIISKARKQELKKWWKELDKAGDRANSRFAYRYFKNPIKAEMFLGHMYMLGHLPGRDYKAKRLTEVMYKHTYKTSNRL